MLNFLDFSPDKPTSHFEDHLCYWLQFVASHANARLGVQLAERSTTVNEWLVLRILLDNPGVPYLVVARILGLGRAATWKTVARLEAGGLVCSALAPGAARAQALSLTAKGAALVPELAALAEDNEFRLFFHLPPGVHGATIGTLQAMAFHHDFGFRHIPRRLKNRPANGL
jgi:DNA-binding MarR family transcriptional regulator